MNWDVLYYIDDAISSKDLISINNTQKNWGMTDYIHYYASLGNETYIKLEEICKKYDQFPLKAILTAISEKYIKMNKVKSGDLFFTDEDFEKGEECLEFLNNIRKNIKVRISNQAIFYFLVVKTYYLNEIDRERLYNSIVSKYGTENYGTSLQCAMVIEHWYNFKYRTYRYISNEILPKR